MADVAALSYEINSSQAKAAARDLDRMNAASQKAEKSATQLQRQINSLNGVNKQLATSAKLSASAFLEFDDAKRQVDALRMSYDPLFAASKQYEAAVDTLNNALRLGVMTQGQYDTALERVGQSYLTAGGQARVYGNAVRASSAHTTNLMFQFQDIGMMLAAGQSPLLLAMQQGTQVSGVFQQMKNSGQSAFSGIIAGLRAMISPMALLTIGTIAAGAALVQWGMSALSADDKAKKAKERFEDLGDVIDALGAASQASARDIEIYLSRSFSKVSGQVQALIDDLRDAEFAILSNEMRQSIEGATKELTRLSGAFDVFWADFMNPGRIDAGYLDQTKEIIANAGIAYDEFVKLDGAVKAVFSAGTTDEFIARLADARAIAADVGGPVGKSVADALLAAAKEAGILNRVMADASGAADDTRRGVNGITNSLDRAVNRALDLRDALADAGRASLSRQDQIAVLTSQISAAERGANVAAAEASTRTARELAKAGATVDQIAEAASRAAAEAERIDILEGVLSDLTTPESRKGGAGGGTDDIVNRVEQIREQIATEREILDMAYEEDMAILSDRRAMEILGEEEHKRIMLEVERQYQEDLAAIRRQENNVALGQAADFFGAMQSVAQAGGEGMTKVAQVFGATRALINAYVAASEALATPGLTLWGRLAAYASVLATGLQLVGAIKGASTGGGGGGRGGGGGGFAPSTVSSATPQEPERVVTLVVQGEQWMQDMVEGLMTQIYEATEDGTRVVVQR